MKNQSKNDICMQFLGEFISSREKGEDYPLPPFVLYKLIKVGYIKTIEWVDQRENMFFEHSEFFPTEKEKKAYEKWKSKKDATM